jgi:hypothetical protein
MIMMTQTAGATNWLADASRRHNAKKIALIAKSSPFVDERMRTFAFASYKDFCASGASIPESVAIAKIIVAWKEEEHSRFCQFEIAVWIARDYRVPRVLAEAEVVS